MPVFTKLPILLKSDPMYRHLKSKLANLFKKFEGLTTVEYAILIALIVIVCIFGVSRLGNSTSDTFQNTIDQMEEQAPIQD
jgi:Flp pilus assembly pilin Flp